jgi:hypothetical protein
LLAVQLLRNSGRQLGVGSSQISGEKARRLDDGSEIAQGITFAYGMLAKTAAAGRTNRCNRTISRARMSAGYQTSR